MQGPEGRPLLVLDREGEGRIAVLGSDQAWLWSRGYEGGGPQLELLRRLAHWLMKEPELEEEVLRGTGEDGARADRAPHAGRERAAGDRDQPVGRDLGGDADRGRRPGSGRAGSTRPRTASGGWRTATSRRWRWSAPRRRRSSRTRSRPATCWRRSPPRPAAASGGSRTACPTCAWCARAGSPTGRGWIGLADRDAYQLRDIRQVDLAPGWLSADPRRRPRLRRLARRGALRQAVPAFPAGSEFFTRRQLLPRVVRPVSGDLRADRPEAGESVASERRSWAARGRRRRRTCRRRSRSSRSSSPASSPSARAGALADLTERDAVRSRVEVLAAGLQRAIGSDAARAAAAGRADRRRLAGRARRRAGRRGGARRTTRRGSTRLRADRGRGRRLGRGLWPAIRSSCRSCCRAPTGRWRPRRPAAGAAGPAAVWPIRLLTLLAGGLIVGPMLRTRRLIGERQRNINELRDREAELERLSRRLGLALDASQGRGLGLQHRHRRAGLGRPDGRALRLSGGPAAAHLRPLARPAAPGRPRARRGRVPRGDRGDRALRLRLPAGAARRARCATSARSARSTARPTAARRSSA